MKKVLLALLILFIVAQLIQPKKNNSTDGEKHWNNIQTKLAIPENAHAIMKDACYDCHSNHTNYDLWYSKITPINFWMASHINEGKEHFNFDELNDYPEKKRAHKLDEFIEEIQENKMPLKVYTITHGDAKLTAEQKEILINWAKSKQ